MLVSLRLELVVLDVLGEAGDELQPAGPIGSIGLRVLYNCGFADSRVDLVSKVTDAGGVVDLCSVTKGNELRDKVREYTVLILLVK